MFHMPGRWEFIFDVRADGRTEPADPQRHARMTGVAG
jgi:hypothetical protein